MNSQKRELVSIRIPVSLNRKLASHVSELGLSKNAFILNLVYEELKKKDAIPKENTNVSKS